MYGERALGFTKPDPQSFDGRQDEIELAVCYAEFEIPEYGPLPLAGTREDLGEVGMLSCQLGKRQPHPNTGDLVILIRK